MIRSILLLALLCAHAYADTWTLPALDDDTTTALSFPVDQDTALTQDNHFDQLLAHTSTWGKRMPLWSAQPEQAPELLGVGPFAAVGSPGFASPGDLFVFGARFIRKAPLPDRPTVERWVVNVFDAETGDRSTTPVVVYIDRAATGKLREPRSGWYVRIAARSYRPTLVESVRGNTLPTQAFVGAAFGSMPNPAGDIAAYFPIFGIAISIIIALAVVLWVFVTLVSRKKPSTTQEDAS